jgi:hypothetical protein
MSPHLQVAAFIIAVLGFCLSCVNLWRSFRTDRNCQTDRFLQKKQESLSLLLRGKVAYINVIRGLNDLIASAGARANDIRGSAERRLAHAERVIENIDRISQKIDHMKSIDITPTIHRMFVENILIGLHQVADGDYIRAVYDEYNDVSLNTSQSWRNLVRSSRTKRRSGNDRCRVRLRAACAE